MNSGKDLAGFGLLLSLLLLLTAVSSAPAEERTTLNGIWDFAPQQEYKPPEKFTHKAYVPGFWNHPDSFNYPLEWKTLPAGWFRRTIDIPQAWQGQRIALCFEGIYMTGQIFFNGRHVANTWDAMNPTTVDVTPLVKWGQPNEIRVGVRAAGAESDELFKQFDQTKVGRDFVPGGTVNAKALALVPYGANRGTEFGQYGLSRDTWLVRTEKVYVENVFVQTSVRRHEIVLDYEIRNASDKPQKVVLSANVTPWKKDQVVLELPTATVDLAPGETKKVQLKKPWATAEAWDPDHPNLYMLHTALQEAGGAFTEKSQQRFGFREAWTQGRNIYLNGNVLHIRGDSLMIHGSTQFFEEDAFRALCKMYRQFNINAFRFHTHCGTLRMYEIMDEEGVMAIAESGLHGSCGDQALQDDRFWKNAREHLRTMVRTERNYPCIIVWSVENEMGAFVQAKQPVKWERLSELTRVVKQNDPTRVAWHDGFAYGFGNPHLENPVEGDVINLHYTPGENWPLYYNFPDALSWARPMLQGKYYSGLPLALGEYGGVCGTIVYEWNDGRHDNCHQCPLLGNRPTKWPDGSLKWYWDLHWQTVAYSIRGNRYSGMAAIDLFTIVQHYLQQSGGCYNDIHITNRQFDWATPGIKFPVLHQGRIPLLDLYNKNRPMFKMQDMVLPTIQANNQMLSFPKHMGSHFWGGGQMSKVFITFNDLYRPSKSRLTITLVDDAGKQIAGFDQRLDIEPGGQREIPVTLNLPALTKVTAVKLLVKHVADAGAKYEESYPILIYPPVDVPEVFLFDPAGQTAPKFADGKVAVKAVESLSALPAGARHVVIGEECLPQVTKGDLDNLVKFAQGGGTVVVLAQNSDAARKAYEAALGNWTPLEARVVGWPYNIKPGPIPTTIAHLPEAKDALTADMTSDDMRFWAKDNALGYYGLMLNKEGVMTKQGDNPDLKPLVICNRTVQDQMRGLLVRVTQGTGQIYLCQLQIADNVGAEPIARLLLARMLNPAAIPTTAPATTAPSK